MEGELKGEGVYHFERERERIGFVFCLVEID